MHFTLPGRLLNVSLMEYTCSKNIRKAFLCSTYYNISYGFDDSRFLKDIFYLCLRLTYSYSKVTTLSDFVTINVTSRDIDAKSLWHGCEIVMSICNFSLMSYWDFNKKNLTFVTILHRIVRPDFSWNRTEKLDLNPSGKRNSAI